MKRRIEELLNDTYRYQAPKLVLSEEHLELMAPADSSLEGEFFFSAGDNSRIRGMLISSNRRIVLAKDTFAGNAIHVKYIIDTRGLKEEDTFDGEITILSPIGEASVSVCVQVHTPEVQTRHGEIRSLESFAKLARSDFREAFHLFVSADFTRFFKGKDACWLPLYRGLSANPAGYQHLEEFLIGCGRKEPVHISIDREEKIYEGLRSSQKNILYVEKDTWGFVRMEVDVQGDFLQVDKRVITSEDFIGSLFGLEYILRRDRLKKGNNYGMITIRTVYDTLQFKVVATNGAHGDDVRLRDKKIRTKLIRSWLSYETGKTTIEQWKEETEDILDTPSDATAYLASACKTAQCLAAGDGAAAVAACWPIKNQEVKTTDPELEGIGLYLLKETGLLPHISDSITDRLYDLRLQAPKSGLLLTLYMRQSEAYTSEKQLEEYEKIADFGSCSPVVYLSVWQILKKEPHLLTSLGGVYFRTLQFAAKWGLLTPETVRMTAILAQYAREWSAPLYRLLSACYEVSQDPEVLTAVLKLIMLEAPAKQEYFVWYARAVEAQVRMTRLYEYYMETIPSSYTQPLPLAIRLYFSYENRLRSDQKAFLYANIIQNRETDPGTYEKYRESMVGFSVESMEKGKINDQYAKIYRHFAAQPENRDMAENLCEVMFACKVTVSDPSIRRIIVCSPWLSEEESYPVREQTAYIQMYTGDEQLLFEDGKKRRFASTVEHKITALMQPDMYTESCLACQSRSFGLLVHTLLPDMEHTEPTDATVRSFLRVAEDERFVDSCRFTARMKALQYYTRNEERELPESIQKMMATDECAGKCKGLIVRAMLQRRKIAGAFDVISRYGYEYIDARLLHMLCMQLIQNMGQEENEELLCLAYDMFVKDKANDAILVYLRDHYVGSLEQMHKIRDLLADREIDTFGIDEELLILSMFLRKPLAHPEEILQSYMQGAFREQVVQSFLVFTAYGWFFEGQPQEQFLIDQMKEFVLHSEGHIICRLALLKHYAGAAVAEADTQEDTHYGWSEDKTPSKPVEITDEDKAFIRSQLEIVTAQGIRLGFFKQLPEELIQAYELDDRIFIECRGDAGETIRIRYCLRGEGEKEREFFSKPMKEMFEGIFAKEFMLFYGEVLEYTLIRENHPTDLNVHTVSGSQIDTGGQTKYHRLNRMLADWHVGRTDALDEEMQKFITTEHLCRQMFTLL